MLDTIYVCQQRQEWFRNYLLDSDVFIQAKNLHYGLDFCPAFWDWLATSNSNGLVYSTESPFEMLRHERARFILGP